MRHNWLSIRAFVDNDNLIGHRRCYGNHSIEQPRRIMSIGMRDWRNVTLRWSPNPTRI